MNHDGLVVLSEIPFRIDGAHLLKTLRMGPDAEDTGRVLELARAAEKIGRPKALCRPAYIDSRADASIVLDGRTFTSRILRVNLESAHRVFPFAATCGVELEQWSRSLNNMLEVFWADSIKLLALTAARDAVNQHMKERYGLEKASTMNPGALPDWPLSEQRPLFELLGDAKEAIGLTLTDSFLMLPTKSVSGIRFPTETTYENCQLCPREKCPGRRAPYVKGLYEKKYASKA